MEGVTGQGRRGSGRRFAGRSDIKGARDNSVATRALLQVDRGVRRIGQFLNEDLSRTVDQEAGYAAGWVGVDGAGASVGAVKKPLHWVSDAVGMASMI